MISKRITKRTGLIGAIGVGFDTNTGYEVNARNHSCRKSRCHTKKRKVKVERKIE